jgi:hypothetical protein
MRTKAKPLLPLFLALSLLALLASGPSTIARNIIAGFTKAPTFTPPAGCIPRTQTYGVLSSCEKTLAPGHTFVASIDTAAGTFLTDTAGNRDIFIDDHLAEIKSTWQGWYPRNNLRFSFRVSKITPGNAPPSGTSCREYSITVETKKEIEKRSVPAVLRVEGLTCAWRVEHASAGKANVELFWLEASDQYAPSLGQKPMKSFDLMVRDLFASVRL